MANLGLHAAPDSVMLQKDSDPVLIDGATLAKARPRMDRIARATATNTAESAAARACLPTTNDTKHT